MSKTVFTGWRTVTPGRCADCGCDDEPVWEPGVSSAPVRIFGVGGDAMAEPSRFDVLRKLLTPDGDTRPVEQQLDTCEMRHGCPSQVCGLPSTRWWVSLEEWGPNHGKAPFGRCCNEPGAGGRAAAWRHAPWASQIEEEKLVEVSKEKAQAEVARMRAAKLFRGQ